MHMYIKEADFILRSVEQMYYTDVDVILCLSGQQLVGGI